MEDEALKAIMDEMSRRTQKEAEDLIMGKIILPDAVEERKMQEEWQKKLYKEWKEQASQVHDPVTKLRKDVMAELADIKKALSKLGILLDSDAPTEEQLEKHKTLKDAYLKYKMVEKLVLGREAK
jgi:hypothetical protein